MTVTFGSAVKDYFRNYANFSGRATRAQYWWVQLALFLALIVPTALLLAGMTGVFLNPRHPDGLSMAMMAVGGLLYVAIVLGCFVPNISIFVRRLHDIGRPGWWVAVFMGGNFLCSCVMSLVNVHNVSHHYSNPSGMLVSLVPVWLVALGLAIWSLVWLCTPSAPDNEYGPNPDGNNE